MREDIKCLFGKGSRGLFMWYLQKYKNIRLHNIIDESVIDGGNFHYCLWFSIGIIYSWVFGMFISQKSDILVEKNFLIISKILVRDSTYTNGWFRYDEA